MLVCRTYIYLEDRYSATFNLMLYVKEKKHFIEDMRNIPNKEPLKDIPGKTKLFF